MSVEPVTSRDGTRQWRVRWREGGRNRSKVVGRKRDADDFDAEIKRRKRLGSIGIFDASQRTLADFGEEWWQLHAEPDLAPRTLELYAMLLDVHIMPRLGPVPLSELTVERLQRFRGELERKGVGRGVGAEVAHAAARDPGARLRGAAAAGKPRPLRAEAVGAA